MNIFVLKLLVDNVYYVDFYENVSGVIEIWVLI